MKKRLRALLFFNFLVFIALSVKAEKYIGSDNISIRNRQYKSLAAPCAMGTTITTISYNNVLAPVWMNGLLWTAPDGENAGYEIPKTSGKTALFSGGIWIAGTDVNEQIKVAALTFNGARNFWPGPLIVDGVRRGTTDSEMCYQWDKHFEISRYQVSDYRQWFNASEEERSRDWEGYTIPGIIFDWPAHGDFAAGYDYNMAPFFDNNEDGAYNPADGDYPFYDLDGSLPCGTTRELRLPRLYGDATIWWVYNDRGDVHYNPQSEPIGFEIRAQAFEFSTSDALNDMSFYNYELINRSTYTLMDTYFGVYADGDLGYAWDDYVGCNVSKGLGYFYNGTLEDGTGQTWAYGMYPPAIGLDFFEGPYQDPDGFDNGTSWDINNKLKCDNDILNGNINGLNFEDGVADNERWGMRRFIYYNNDDGVMGDPTDPVHYYNYLRGFWKDNERLRFRGTGHPSDSRTTNVETDFMFPGVSDPCGWGQGGRRVPNWTEINSNNAPSDRRFVQSSGPFTLEPGAINDITVGVVWARAFSGGLQGSVNKMLNSDELAQRLFENCFQVVDGPDAPELTIVEMDKQLIFHIWNKPLSNNYMEAYDEIDPFIICPLKKKNCDTRYKFQGYKIYQLKDPTVSITAISEHDTNLARMVFQCDIEDGVSQIVNYYWNEDLNSDVPIREVLGADRGIEHSFKLETDAFAIREKTLINHKKYYFMAVAYAHNDYMFYDPYDIDTYEGQKKPFKMGRKGVGGGIKSYEVIPHIIEPEMGGTKIKGNYGDSPEIIQVEGHGAGSNILDLTEETIEEIMSGPPWKAEEVAYKPGFAPVNVIVVEPMNVPEDNFIIKMDSVDWYYRKGATMNGKINDASWYIVRESTSDTVRSHHMITSNFDQLIIEWGISISNFPLAEPPFQLGSRDNGFLDATMEFEDPDVRWLTFLRDTEREFTTFPANWIRSGYVRGDYAGDKAEVYEKVLQGAWAPFKMTSRDKHGPALGSASLSITTKRQRLASVDLVITSDRDKWTRSPVLEMGFEPALTINNTKKYKLRASPSIDKWGNPEYPDNPDSTGMGWFPGYAIDVETGERLNIIYGESSWLSGDNGDDMMWNPSSRIGSALYHRANGSIHSSDGGGQVFFGGKHYIYIMGHNRARVFDRNRMTPYDEGKLIYKKLNSGQAWAIKEILKNAMWTSIPLVDSLLYKKADLSNDPYGFIQNDVTIKLRVASWYSVDVYDFAKPDSIMELPGYTGNFNKPMYKFSTSDIATLRGDRETGVMALDLIRVVPNPYYGFSKFERTQIDNIVKITNLPQKCTISIYALNGTLIRRFGKDNEKTYLEWNLKNSYGIPISGGVYILHINAFELGEKVVKFMGVMRPIDLTSF